MNIVRIKAVSRESGYVHSNKKLILLCAIDADGYIADGEWLGYVQNDKVIWPFVLKNGSSFCYGGEEHYTEPTNIGKGAIENGRLFTLFSPPGGTDIWEATYEIVSCHSYASLD